MIKRESSPVDSHKKPYIKRQLTIEVFNQMFKQRVVTETLHVHPDRVPQTIFMNNDSWLQVHTLEEPHGLSLDEFERIWSLKPSERLQVMFGGRVLSCPRYARSYLRSYNFSGLNHVADTYLPARLDALLKYCQVSCPLLNQSLVNWYEKDGSIGKHSDDQRPLVQNSSIYSLTFGPAKRVFILEQKNGVGKKYHIHLQHNTLVIMGGNCQTFYHHHVPKQQSPDEIDGRRLNVTFRCFK